MKSMKTKYKCEQHKLDIVCLPCIVALKNREQKLLEFVKKLAIPLKDRDDYFEAWQNEAKNILTEIGEA